VIYFPLIKYPLGNMTVLGVTWPRECSVNRGQYDILFVSVVCETDLCLLRLSWWLTVTGCVAGSQASSGRTCQCPDDVQHCTVPRCNATHCRLQINQSQLFYVSCCEFAILGYVFVWCCRSSVCGSVVDVCPIVSYISLLLFSIFDVAETCH